MQNKSAEWFLYHGNIYCLWVNLNDPTKNTVLYSIEDDPATKIQDVNKS